MFHVLDATVDENCSGHLLLNLLLLLLLQSLRVVVLSSTHVSEAGAERLKKIAPHLLVKWTNKNAKP